MAIFRAMTSALIVWEKVTRYNLLIKFFVENEAYLQILDMLECFETGLD